MVKDNKNKKVIIRLTVMIVLGLIAFAILSNLNSKENTLNPTFSIENNMLIGKQDGLVQIINVASKKLISTIDLKEEASKDYSPILNVDKSSIFGKVEIKEEINEESKEIPELVVDENKIIPNSLVSRDVKVVGEKDGYDIVSVDIITGDYWLKIQRQLVKDVPEFVVLRIGREINKDQVLHPIYNGNVLLFIAEKGLFSNGIITEEKVEEIAEEIPVEESENPALIEIIPEIGETEKNSSINDYVFSFTEDGFYVYDNNSSRFYEIIIEDNNLSLDLVCFSKDVVLKEYEFKNDIFYFSTSDNSSIYAFDGSMYAKISIDSQLEDWTIDNNYVYYAAIEAIYRVDILNKEQIYLYLGDKTTDINIIRDNIYVSNKFGSTIAKSVLHKLDKNLISYGWAELNYAKDTGIVYEKDGEFLVKQNLHGVKDKLVYINNEFDMQYEVGLEVLHDKIRVYNDENIYGLCDGVLYLYSMQGDLIDKVNLEASEIYIY